MVQAKEALFRKLLDGGKQYYVPLYQRPYQWGEKEWAKLWEDLMELTLARRGNNQAHHFIGSVVLAPEVSTALPASVKSYLVIDGQQRLTTMSIILAALRDELAGSGQAREAEKINSKSLVNKHHKGSGHLKLVPTKIDLEYYQSIILGTPRKVDDSRVYSAYDFFRNELKGLPLAEDDIQLAEVEQAISNGLLIVSIATESGDNPHRIFQSLNNTGVKLTQGDLIRNDVFMRLPNDSEDVYQNYWLPMQEKLGNKQLEHFFALDLARTYPGLKSDEIFRAFQMELRKYVSEEEIGEEIRRLRELSDDYHLMLHPLTEKDTSVRKRLQRIASWGNTAPYAFILRALYLRRVGMVTNSDLAESLRLIESCLVRRLLSGASTDGLKSFFSGLATETNESTNILETVKLRIANTQNLSLSDQSLSRYITELRFFEKGSSKQRRLLLTWIEESLGSKEAVETAELTIEHVMPQTLSPEWINELSDGRSEDEVLALHKKLVHTLGNLTLTGYNSEMKNSVFEVKKKEFLRTGLSLSAGIAEEEQWTFEEIIKRSEWLAEIIVKEWSIS